GGALKPRPEPAELAAEGALDRVAHRELEHGEHCVGRERPQPLERVADLRPALLGAPGFLERLPDLIEEELDEDARGAVGVAAQLLDDVQRARRRDPEPSELGAGAPEARADLLVVAVPERPQEAEPDRALQQPGIAAPALRQLGPADHPWLLVRERLAQRAREAKDVGARALGVVEQAADELEVQSVRLQLLDQLHACDVLRPVVAGPPADVRWRQQATRLVRADVAHRHAGALGQLVDREPGVRGHGEKRMAGPCERNFRAPQTVSASGWTTPASATRTIVLSPRALRRVMTRPSPCSPPATGRRWSATPRTGWGAIATRPRTPCRMRSSRGLPPCATARFRRRRGPGCSSSCATAAWTSAAAALPPTRWPTTSSTRARRPRSERSTASAWGASSRRSATSPLRSARCSWGGSSKDEATKSWRGATRRRAGR